MIFTSQITAQTSIGAAPNAPANTWVSTPNADVTTTGWTKSGCGSTFASCVNDFPDASGSSYFYGPNASNTSNAITLDNLDTPTGFATATSITLDVYAMNNRTTDDTEALTPAILNASGVAISNPASAQTLSTSWTDYTWNLQPVGFENDAALWNGMRLKLTSTWTQVNTKDTTARVQIASARLTITYRSTAGTITQQGYIFENDDGNGNPDGNSAQAAGNTAITSVKKGERIDVRDQLLSSTNAENANAGLFYDRNDGYWSQVRASTTPIISAGSCGDTNFSCTDVDSAARVDQDTSVAVDNNGHSWTSYYEEDDDNLKAAEYVGSGGTGCASTAWNCVVLTNSSGAGGEGVYNSIAIDGNNNVWIAFWDEADSQLMVAENVPGSGCVVSSWTCTIVQSNVEMDTSQGDTVSIAIGPTGTPWIAYHNVSSSTHEVFVSQYVGSNGTCTSTAWTGCTSDIQGGGTFVSMAISPTGVPWIAYEDGSYELIIAHWVGSGGSNCDIGASWSCTIVEPSNDDAAYMSIAFAPDGNPWISFDADNALIVANYLGGSTSGTGCSVNTFTCTTVDTTGDDGVHSTIAFDPSGKAWIIYQDQQSNNLKLARYAVSGGNCTSTNWKCTVIQSGSTGGFPSLSFGPDGTAWISFNSSNGNDLYVANLNRGGEIKTAPGLAAGSSGTISKSHSDMTSATDTTNQNDADCISGTWTSGKAFTSEVGTGASIPAGNCTELMFTIDTSQAQPSTTYRLITAFSDVGPGARSFWRGPYTESQYPTLTIESATTVRYGKDALPDSANCTLTTWACSALASTGNAGDVSDIAIDQQGNPWVVYDKNGGGIESARYVGSGGSCVDNPAWNCTDIDTSSYQPDHISIQVGPDGSAWVVYSDLNATPEVVHAAHYVGTNSNGLCGGASSAWSCWSVVSVGSGASASPVQPHLALDPNGNPWISYFDTSNNGLGVARFNSNNGFNTTSCSSGAVGWSCEIIASGSKEGRSNAIAFDNNGMANISYAYGTSSTPIGVKLATFTGVGGTGCNSGVTDWSCVVVDNTGSDVGLDESLAFDTSNYPWISYYDHANGDLKVAHKTSSTPHTCAGGATSWACDIADKNSSDVGYATSIAFDAAGTAWVKTTDNTNAVDRVDHYVTSGGGSAAGCGTGSSAAWSCSSITTSYHPTTLRGSGGLAFDDDGEAWATIDIGSTNDLNIAKMRLPMSQLSYQNKSNSNNHNAKTADARFHLDAGLSPRTSTCAGNTGLLGYCAITSKDSVYDSITASANQQPYYTFAIRSGSNTSLPSYAWTGKTDALCSTANMKIDVYQFGSVNSWVNLNSNSSCSTGANFNLVGTVTSGTASQFWEADGSNYWTYYRVYQASSSGSETVSTDYFGTPPANSPPNTPTALAQYKSDGITSISAGGWTNETQVVLKSTVSDPDSDATAMCVEIGLTLSSPASPSLCGSNVASGSTASVNPTGLTSGSTYKWQAKSKDSNGAYSSTYAQFNSGSGAFEVDTVAPATGSVYDGSNAGVEAVYNNGSLSSLSCNWSSFGDALSGIGSYDYSLGTTPNGADVTPWSNVSNSTTGITATGLSLHTSQPYYCSVRAHDVAGNVSTAVSSAGQYVAPTLSFTTSTSTLNLGSLTPANSYTATGTIDVTTSTNAYNGYVVHQYENGPLTKGSLHIGDYASPYSSPSTWSGTGFGYTSSDSSIQSSGNLFAGGTKFAAVATGSPGDVVADHSSGVVGTPISSEKFTLTYRVTVSGNQSPATYTNAITLSALASY